MLIYYQSLSITITLKFNFHYINIQDLDVYYVLSLHTKYDNVRWINYLSVEFPINGTFLPPYPSTESFAYNFSNNNYSLIQPQRAG